MKISQASLSPSVKKSVKVLQVQRIMVIVFCLRHGSALEGSDPHEKAPGFEVCQMKGTHIGASELTLFKSYEIGLLRIRPLCF